MSALTAFFSPGPMELLILGMICVLPLVAAVVLVVVLRSAKPAPPPPCAKCGGWTVPGTKFCPHCGSALGVLPPASGSGNEPQ
jgi:hypothetical protein